MSPVYPQPHIHPPIAIKYTVLIFAFIIIMYGFVCLPSAYTHTGTTITMPKIGKKKKLFFFSFVQLNVEWPIKSYSWPQNLAHTHKNVVVVGFMPLFYYFLLVFKIVFPGHHPPSHLLIMDVHTRPFSILHCYRLLSALSRLHTQLSKMSILHVPARICTHCTLSILSQLYINTNTIFVFHSFVSF